MYTHKKLMYTLTHMFHTPQMYICTHTCTHANTQMHVHTTYHTSHTCGYSVTYTNAHTCSHIHITLRRRTLTLTHCNMHCTLTTHTNTLTLTRVHSHVDARHPVGSRAPCLGAVARLPSSGLVGPLGAQPAASLCKPASSSPGTPPRALGTRGLCVGPQGRPLGLRCPGPSDRPAPSAWSSRLAAPP